MIKTYIEQLKDQDIVFDEPWDYVIAFEQAIASFCGADYAIAVDSCTHAIEACLNLMPITETTIPARTYPSIPQMLFKCGFGWDYEQKSWTSFYEVGDTKIIDGAMAFDRNCYVDGTLFCLSFQAKKRLALGRGGAILTNDRVAAARLRRFVCDGREMPGNWKRDVADIRLGSHYHMIPDVAALGLLKLRLGDIGPFVVASDQDYPDLSAHKNITEI